RQAPQRLADRPQNTGICGDGKIQTVDAYAGGCLGAPAPHKTGLGGSAETGRREEYSRGDEDAPDQQPEKWRYAGAHPSHRLRCRSNGRIEYEGQIRPRSLPIVPPLGPPQTPGRPKDPPAYR